MRLTTRNNNIIIFRLYILLLFCTWECQLQSSRKVFSLNFPNFLVFTSYFPDVGEIYARLFDHKPFTSAEIQYCLCEFEVSAFESGWRWKNIHWNWYFQEKRNDREIENLFSTAQNTTEVKDSAVARCKALSEVQLPVLNKILQDTLRDCEKAANRLPDPELEATLEKNRASRKIILDEFVDDMSHKSSRVDNTFEEKEEELRDFYSDLERKLHIHK